MLWTLHRERLHIEKSYDCANMRNRDELWVNESVCTAHTITHGVCTSNESSFDGRRRSNTHSSGGGGDGGDQLALRQHSVVTYVVGDCEYYLHEFERRIYLDSFVQNYTDADGVHVFCRPVPEVRHLLVLLFASVLCGHSKNCESWIGAAQRPLHQVSSNREFKA